jgi:hypothetical protein
MKLTGDWKKLHSEDLYDLYAAANIILFIKSGRIRWAGNMLCIGENTKACRILIGKPEGKRPLGRS